MPGFLPATKRGSVLKKKKKRDSPRLWRIVPNQLTDMSQIRVSLYLLLLILGL